MSLKLIPQLTARETVLARTAVLHMAKRHRRIATNAKANAGGKLTDGYKEHTALAEEYEKIALAFPEVK